MAIRISQAGVALTVGIIIVTGLIIGGFFLVKNSGEQARRDEAIRIAEQNLEEQSGDDVAIVEEESEDKQHENMGHDDANTSVSEPAEGNTPSDEATSEDDSAQAATELPRTGTGEQVSSIVALTLLTFSVTSYVASRRQA